MGEAVVDYLVDFVHGLDDAPRRGHRGRHRARSFAPRRRRRRWAAIFDELFEQMQAAAARTYEYAALPATSPYIPGGGLYTAALAEFLAQGVNRYIEPVAGRARPWSRSSRTSSGGSATCSTYPETRRGILTSGGSMANFSAIVTARHTKLGEDFLRRHVLRQRAGPRERCRRRRPRRLLASGTSGVVPTDAELRMDAEALREHDRARIARRASGRSWWCPSAGTTNTGAIDPLDDVADDRGGRGALDARGRGVRRVLPADRARPANGSPGSSGPTRSRSTRTRGCSCRTARARSWSATAPTLRDAHYAGAAYLQDLRARGGAAQLHRVLARALAADTAGLRVWLPLKLHGVGAFREALDEKLDLTDHLHDVAPAGSRQIEIPWEPQLTVVPFRLRGADDDDEPCGSWHMINASKRVFLSSTLGARSRTCSGRASSATGRTVTGSTSASTSSRTPPRELAGA